MSKPNIDALIDNYQGQINDFYTHIDAALNVWDQRKEMSAQGFPTLETSDLEHIYESALVKAVVSWQGLAANWVVAALAHDSSELRDKIGGGKRAGLNVSRNVQVFVEPKRLAVHSSLETIRSLLEAEGRYLSVNTKKSWSSYSKVLAPQFQRKVAALTEDDHLVIELCTALRNGAAHRSAESIAKLKTVLASDEIRALDGRSKPMVLARSGITAAGIGHYLAVEMKNPYGEGRQNTRLAYLLGALRRMSEKLR